MAGNKQRNVLIAVLGVGLAGFLADRLLVTEPVTGPSAADAAIAVPSESSAPRAVPRPTALLSVAAQVGAAAADVPRRPRDAFRAPMAWVTILEQQAEEHRRQEASRTAPPAARPGEPEKLIFHLVAILNENGVPKAMLVVEPAAAPVDGPRPRPVSYKVVAGESVRGYTVVRIEPITIRRSADGTPQTVPGAVVLERHGERITLSMRGGDGQ